MRFEILTIFPEMLRGLFEHGVVSRGVKAGLIEIGVRDLREFTGDRHRTVDDRPFGGGEGMVLKAEPLAAALEAIGVGPLDERNSQSKAKGIVILLSAQGRRFTQAVARELASLERIVLICGRYEGVDERVNELYCDMELSIGDYVLSGGELAAAVVLDAVSRLVPGVLGNAASGEFESFGVGDSAIAADLDGVPRSQHGAGGLLDYPHYTRPAEFRGLHVPDVLLGGDHAAVRKWRREQQLRKTLRNRPDLLEDAELSKWDLEVLERIRREGLRNLAAGQPGNGQDLSWKRAASDPDISGGPPTMKKPVLIVVDMLNDFLDTWDPARRRELVRAVNDLAGWMRNLSLPVIWVSQEFEPDLSDAFLEMKASGIQITISGTKGCQIVSELEVDASEIVVLKKRYSAFFGTQLDAELERIKPDAILLAGVNTHACIRTTAIDAYQRDWPVILASDAIDSYDREHHEVSMRYMKDKIAAVMSNREIQMALGVGREE